MFYLSGNIHALSGNVLINKVKWKRWSDAPSTKLIQFKKWCSKSFFFLFFSYLCFLYRVFFCFSFVEWKYERKRWVYGFTYHGKIWKMFSLIEAHTLKCFKKHCSLKYFSTPLSNELINLVVWYSFLELAWCLYSTKDKHQISKYQIEWNRDVSAGMNIINKLFNSKYIVF